MPGHQPEIRYSDCLNTHLGEPAIDACTRCRDVCPAGAICLDAEQQPVIEAARCTDCAGCIQACPVDVIGEEASLDPAALAASVGDTVRRHGPSIQVACSAATPDADDLEINCHTEWDPLLLASLAAEGVRTLHLAGIDQCASCPKRFGAERMRQTEKDYASLNQGLGVRLRVDRQRKAGEPAKAASTTQTKVPERRAFFRSLLPALSQSAAAATAQIARAADQALQSGAMDQAAANVSGLPVRLWLFLRALPKLQASFTPVPSLDSLPIGSIQATDRCTACNACVGQCPTEALSLRDFGKSKILEFRAEACIGCSQCIDRCPEDALEKLPSISLPSLLTGKKRPLVIVPAERIAGSADAGKVEHG